MSRMLFNKHIFQRGYDYFIKRLVKNVKNEGNTFYGTVKGTYDYDVSIVYSDYNDDVLYMDCDCPYAMSGHICKHEAALYIHIKEMKLRESSKVFENPIARQLNSYKTRGYSDFKISDFLKRDIHRQLNRIGIIKTYNSERVTKVWDLINDVLTLDLSDFEKNELLNDMLNHLYVWKENHKYCDHMIDNCKKAILEEKHLLYINVMMWFLKKHNRDSIKEYIISLLKLYNVKEDYVEQLMYYLYEFIKDKDVCDVLDKLSKYDTLDVYRLYQVRQLLIEDKVNEALTMMQEQNLQVPKVNSMLTLKEKIDYATKNKEGYLQFILEYFQEPSHYREVQFIERYKKLCGKQWNDEKYPFLDALVANMRIEQKESILNKLDEYEYVLNLVIEHINEFGQYEDILKRHDIKMYRYIFFEFIRNKLSSRMTFYLPDLEEYLEMIESTNPSDEEMLEIILRLQDCVRYDTAIFEYFENYLKKKGFDRYVEIFEY